MNAIIALCHFCDNHGPKVMYCTQPFSHEAQEDFGGSDDWTESLRGAPSVVSESSTKSSRSTAGSTGHMDLCDACRSLPADVPGLISRDKEARVSYTSSQCPSDSHAFTKVRGACVRSLSSEVCPGREGPIFFGDEKMGHVISYTFFLKDASARGEKRWYSIIVLMMDKTYLLNSYTFLVKHVRETVEVLQNKAAAVFDKENVGPAKPSPVRMRSVSSRLHRGHASVRSLCALTGDDDVFKILHMRFTWILKVASSRFTEKILEGPPTEDVAVSLELEDDCNQDLEDGQERSTPQNGACCQDDDLTDETDDGPLLSDLRELYKIMGYHCFHAVAYHVVIGNQVILRCASKRLIRSVFDCLKILLPRGCCKIIYYSETYEPTYKCSFLGLPLSVDLPSHCEESEEQFLVVDIHFPDDPVAASTHITTDPKFKGYKINYKCKNEVPRKGPVVLEKMEMAISNQNLRWNVVEQCLMCLKEEWMNKVKVVFTFTKAGGNRTKEDTKKLLASMGAQAEDKKVLKFWMTGLSRQYKNYMLTSSVQNSVLSL